MTDESGEENNIRKESLTEACYQRHIQGSVSLGGRTAISNYKGFEKTFSTKENKIVIVTTK